MKKLLLLLLLAFPASVMAQEIIYQYTTVPITYEEQNFLNLNQTQQQGENYWDDEVRQVDIGFDFTFYGETFSSLYLSNNGLLSFLYPVNGCCSGEPLPTSSFYDYSIFFLWTDLVNIETLNPYISSYGTEGNRRLTIGFYDMPVYYDSSLTSTFEISLWEGSNYIFLNYADINTDFRTVTAGLQGDSSLGEYTQLYYGNDASSTLSNTSWLFYSGVYIDPGPGDPEEPPPPEPEQPTNCLNAPSNLNCQLADNDQQVNDPVVESVFIREERTLVAESTIEQQIEEQLIAETQLEEMLAVEARESTLENTETAAALVDNIDANVLDIVLAIVEATSTTEQSSQQTSSSSTVVSTASESGSTESSMDSSVTESAEMAFEMLAQGQVFAQENIANTVDQSQQQSEVAVQDTVLAFEQQQEIGTTEDQSMIMAFEPAQETQQQQDVVNEFGQVQLLTNDFSQPQQTEQFNEDDIFESLLANLQESNKQEEQETFTEPMVVMIDMNPGQMGFNPVFSITNLEMAGVLNQREEKSDAEKRADLVIAANKEQQDAINANYMDADQGGILAAMDTGTDFTQYRNTMLRDVDFYKPEDIYKNVVYRDNVRGMYFLEKGSTDTYKKMVDEQYK